MPKKTVAPKIIKKTVPKPTQGKKPKVTTKTAKPITPSPVPDLAAWLDSNPTIRDAIIWEDETQNCLPYVYWDATKKADLATAFSLAWIGGSFLTQDPVPNKKILATIDANGNEQILFQNVAQTLDISYAWPMYISYVAQSLAVEIGQRVPWSITSGASYSTLGLYQLFHSHSMFYWNASEAGYTIVDGDTYMPPVAPGSLTVNGRTLPCVPNLCWDFLSNGKIGLDRQATIYNVLEWCRNTLVNEDIGQGSAVNYDLYQYWGYPPVSLMIQGSNFLKNPKPTKENATTGCWTTVGFLKVILRTINIPVEFVEGGPGGVGHALPHFIEDGLYLSHGDDLFCRVIKPPNIVLPSGMLEIPISEYTIDQGTFDSWFGPAITQDIAMNNVGRRSLDLELTYISNLLLHHRCNDKSSGASNDSGEVYQYILANGKSPYQDMATIEKLSFWGPGVDLWQALDNKIAGFPGGCNDVSGLPF